MAKGTLLEALGKAIIFFMGDVLMGFLEQFFGAVKAAGVVQARVHRRVIIQVLAIVNRCLFDFANGVIDRVNGFFFLMAQFAVAPTDFQVGASRAQIGKSMKVSGMPALSGSQA